MSDDSLMSPDVLKLEIKYLETILVPEREERVADILTRIDKAFKHFHHTNERSDRTYVLTDAQVYEVIDALAACKVDYTDQFARTNAHYLKRYKALVKDRRWLIASKLKFLAR